MEEWRQCIFVVNVCLAPVGNPTNSQNRSTSKEMIGYGQVLETDIGKENANAYRHNKKDKKR